MKKTIVIVMVAAVGILVMWQLLAWHSADALLRERALWQKERAELQRALENAKGDEASPAPVVQQQQIVQVRSEANPRDIIRALQQIKITAGPAQIRNTRLAIQQLENLIAAGPAGVPAIREFLLQNEDIIYDSPVSLKGLKEGKIATEFMVPPSLRFGLFEAAKRIGGSDAETLLADTLANTGRGAEVAYLTYTLQELAPYKYRDLSVNSARELLARPIPPGAGVDKYDREYLYAVLAFYGDNSFAAEAQAHLVDASGNIDKAALNYLLQTMGPEALASVAKAYENPAVDPSKKEPLVRYALAFAGANPQATDFWHSAVNDPAFPRDRRREWIEDLNQDGIQNEGNPTVRDAGLIAARLELIERYYNETQDPGIRDAWREAGKDLKHMGEKFLGLPETPYVLGEPTTDLRDALRNRILPVQ